MPVKVKSSMRTISTIECFDRLARRAREPIDSAADFDTNSFTLPID